MSHYILFDVNETLLDLSALDPFFTCLFGDADARAEWFFTLEESWLTATVIDQYKPLGELAEGALSMLGERYGIGIDREKCSELTKMFKSLPAHADVLPALQVLRDSGFHLTALTNGGLDVVKQQLSAAGLIQCFDAVMSADEVKRFKPAPAPYRMAAERLGVTTGELTMVAAHAWDIAGAANAGCRTVFVERPGKVLNPAGIQPNLVGSTMHAVAEQIIAQRS